MSEQKSQGMTQTRRAFIGQGALAFLAAAGMGHRAFGATGPARLKFGALSDIHITRGKGSCDIFEKALTYFRDQKVDAVLIAGDRADSGLDSQLWRVGETRHGRADRLERGVRLRRENLERDGGMT